MSKEKYAPPLLSEFPNIHQRSTKLKDILKDGIRFPKLIHFQDPSKITYFVNDEIISNKHDEDDYKNIGSDGLITENAFDRNVLITNKIRDNNKTIYINFETIYLISKFCNYTRFPTSRFSVNYKYFIFISSHIGFEL